MRFSPLRADPISRELKRAVDDYFLRAGVSPFGDWRLWTKAVLLLGGVVTTWLVLVLVPLPSVAALALAALLGSLIAAVGMAVGHDALHGSFSTRPWINRLVGLSFDLIGANSYIWRHTHNRTHHVFTNVNGVDLDLDLAPFFGVTPGTPRAWIHQWQHLYALPLYAATTLHWLLFKDFRYYTLERLGMRRDVRHPWWAWAWLIGGKAFALSTHLVIPLLVAPYPWWQVLIGFGMVHIVAGLLMATIFQLAHQVGHVAFPETDGRGMLPWSFLVHQLRTTTNFACENRALSWLVGGLNFQVEHHLFPQIASVHYPALRPIVREIAARHGEPYHEYPNFISALRGHLNWLREEGNKWSAVASEGEVFASLHPFNRTPPLDHLLLDGQKVGYPAAHRGGCIALGQAGAAFDAQPLIESYHLVTPRAPRLAASGESEDPLRDPAVPVSPFTFEDADFYRALKRRVREWQQNMGIRDFYAPPVYLVIWVVHVVAILATNLLAWRHGWLGSWFLACVFAGTASVLRALMLLREAHASTHYTVVANPTINSIINQISWGMISVQCADRLNATHVEIHHLYTSTWRVDDSAFPGIRTSRRERYHPWNRYQHWYATALYATILLLVPLQEWWSLATGRRFAGRRLINLLFSICFAVFYYGGAFATGNVPWLLAAVCPASLILAAAFAVNHQVEPCVENADRHALDQAILRGQKRLDFGQYQAQVTPNHSEDSWAMNQLLGGLNHHRTHHLLPKVHYHYYPALTRVVNQVLQDYRVPVVTYPTFFTALRGHYALLRMRAVN